MSGPYAIVRTDYADTALRSRKLVLGETGRPLIFRSRNGATRWVSDIKSNAGSDACGAPAYSICSVLSVPVPLRADIPRDMLSRAYWAGSVDLICQNLSDVGVFSVAEIKQVRDALLGVSRADILYCVVGRHIDRACAEYIVDILDARGLHTLAVKVRLAIPAHRAKAA